MLDHKAVHKAQACLIITWVGIAYILELERDILYEDCDFEIDSDDKADLEKSELP